MGIFARRFSKEPQFTVKVEDNSERVGYPAFVWLVEQKQLFWNEPIAGGVEDTFAKALKEAHNSLAAYRKELNKDVYREQVR